ncbi:IPTL-CTERM sorting domain-containing protein [Ottowia sp. GY511]|nr:IPTL-CTERM sorting domain-containing protein [Ottowia sp. GY511]
MTGNTRVTNNVAAGGGGSGRNPVTGGNNNGGRGVGGLWNDGALYRGATVVISGNLAASGGAGGGGTVPNPIPDLYWGSPQTGWVLEVAVTGSGSVSADTVATPSMGGISGCASTGGAACVAGYEAAQVAAQVTLTATAPAGGTFTGWGGACSGTALTCTVAMDRARSVTATFAGGPAVAVPTLGAWSLALLGLMAAGLAGRGLRGRRSL